MLIAEVSRNYDISTDTLRYYERIGLLPPVTRRSNGIRDYSEEDLNWVSLIKCMRAAGVEVEALIDYVTLYQMGSQTCEERKQILIEQRERLRERMAVMQESLDRLDYKIENYEKLFD